MVSPFCCPAGGAIVALHSASVQLAGHSTLASNRAGVGGALHAKDNSSIAVREATLLRDNVADKDGGAVAVEGNAKVRLERGAASASCPWW